MDSDRKFDFGSLVKSPWLTELSHQLTEYEKKAKVLVHELDLKSQVAREKSLKHLEKMSSQLTKARAELERRANQLLQKESKRLNEAANELLAYVRSIAKAEKPAKKRSRRGGSKKTTQLRARKRPSTRVSAPATAAPNAASQEIQPTA